MSEKRVGVKILTASLLIVDVLVSLAFNFENKLLLAEKKSDFFLLSSSFRSLKTNV